MKKIVMILFLLFCSNVHAQQPQQPVPGFVFSGDFRLRFDAQARHGNEYAPALQNIRSRYRFRFNGDKQIDPRMKVHFQLSTGPRANSLTNDQDMAGFSTKPEFTLSEVYLDFKPSKKLSLRAGRMEEVFADTMRFLWDDDVRFNGFNQTYAVGKGLELRGGEYILSNPNQRGVRAANLFHFGGIYKKKSHQIGLDEHVYRNVNQIQQATVSGILASGNATTTPNGAILASEYRVTRALYHYDSKIEAMPFYLDVQVASNTAARDAKYSYAATGSAVISSKPVIRVLYRYAVKEANSMLAQFTDDDLSTGTGVNTRVHAIRTDVGLSKNVQWQNLFFIQNAIDCNRPGFYVPVPAGAHTTYRFLGQLAISF